MNNRDFLRKWAAGKTGILGKYWSRRFTTPPFLAGLAHIFDFGGTLSDDYKPSGRGFEEDIAALRSDWIAIGQDMRDVMGEYIDHEPGKPTDARDRNTHGE